MRYSHHAAIAAWCLTFVTSAWAGADRDTAFFESRIRPVLVEHC